MEKHLACRWHNQGLNPGLHISFSATVPWATSSIAQRASDQDSTAKIVSKTRYLAGDQQQVKARISGRVWEVMVLSWCLGSFWSRCQLCLNTGLHAKNQ